MGIPLTSADAAIIAQAFRDEIAADEAMYAGYVPDSLYTRGAARAVAAVNKAHAASPAKPSK
jgi:hypothetical protein